VSTHFVQPIQCQVPLKKYSQKKYSQKYSHRSVYYFALKKKVVVTE